MIVITSIALLLFSAEIVLHKVFPIDTDTMQYRVPHPVFGWVLKPDARYLYRMPETTVRVTYNSKGFRDDEHSIENRHDVFRILVLGDSFMEAYSVATNNTFYKQIEQFARKRNIDVEVINMGVGGYGTLQEYLIYREAGALYKPDLVLLGFNISNDVRNNSIKLESIANKDTLKTKARPFLQLAESGNWQITAVNYKEAQNRYAMEQARQNAFPEKWMGRSAVLQTMKRVQKNVLRKLAAGREPQMGPAPEEWFIAMAGVYYCQELVQYTEAWDITKNILTRLKQDMQAMAGELVVFTVPAHHEVDAGEIENAIKIAPDPEKFCLREARGYDRLASILEDLDIKYVDLLPDFRNVMHHGGVNLFRRSDGHWNEDGHHLAAEQVGLFLAEKDLLKKIKISKTDQDM